MRIFNSNCNLNFEKLSIFRIIIFSFIIYLKVTISYPSLNLILMFSSHFLQVKGKTINFSENSSQN